MFFLPVLGHAQTIEEIDSVCENMCEYLNSLEGKSDTVKLNTLYRDRLYPYLDKFEKSEVDDISQNIYYRLQRNCREFGSLLSRIYPPKSDIPQASEKPKSIATTEQVEKFKELKSLYYLELSGKKTNVELNKKKWVEFFPDGSYSKLKLRWINEREFQLIFKKSNNESRGNMSVKGDIYVYQIMSKEDDYYYVSGNVPGQNIYNIFKFYIK